MRHAIQFLEHEAEQIKKILQQSEELNKLLSIWDSKPESVKIISDKLESLEKAISYLKTAESFNNAVEGKTL